MADVDPVAQQKRRLEIESWSKQVKAELEAAGFAVQDYGGCPLVPLPDTHEGKYRLLKFRTSGGADRIVYEQGMLFVPPGWAAALEGRR